MEIKFVKDVTFEGGTINVEYAWITLEGNTIRVVEELQAPERLSLPASE